MLIRDVLPVYFGRNPKIRNSLTKDKYRFALNNLREAIGHEPKVSDLCDESVCKLISLLQSRSLSPCTVNERMGRIHALWRWLAKTGKVKHWPTTPRVPEPKRDPRAWSRNELQQLFRACSKTPGRIGDLMARQWWTTLHLVAWDTGERISALLACRWDWLSDGWLQIPAESRKGKARDRSYQLHQHTLDHLSAFRLPQRDLIWPWPLHRSSLWNHYRRLRRRAGLPIDRRSAFHRIRKSVATHCEAAGGNATELLDHSDRRVTKVYLDPRYTNSPQAISFLFRPESQESKPGD